MIGIQGPQWLASPDWALVSVILLDTWQWTPFVLLVAGAAIASVPGDLLEVAAIDGASRWKTFLYIELPLLMPLLLLTLVFRMLESLLSLDSIYSLTFGGPGFSTYTLTFYIYTQGAAQFQFRRGGGFVLDLHGFREFRDCAGILVPTAAPVAADWNQ